MVLKSRKSKIEKTNTIIKETNTFHQSIEIKTYEEEAIEIINHLKSQGIDIYDESRYGGMYLKQNNQNIDDYQNNDNQEDNILEIDDIKNFFKK